MRRETQRSSTRSAKHPVRWLTVGTIVGMALSGGCASIDLPTDSIPVSRKTSQEEYLSKIRKTALADPFPSAAEVGLKSADE